MKYFLEFEGKEKLVLKVILFFQLIITILLGYLCWMERPIDIHITPDNLGQFEKSVMECIDGHL